MELITLFEEILSWLGIVFFIGFTIWGISFFRKLRKAGVKFTPLTEEQKSQILKSGMADSFKSDIKELLFVLVGALVFFLIYYCLGL